MLGTIIKENGDGLLEDSHMPVGWPLHIDGAVRQCCIHRAASLQELDDMLKEYDMKRDSAEINRDAPMVPPCSMEPKVYGTETRIHTGATMGRPRTCHKQKNDHVI